MKNIFIKVPDDLHKAVFAKLEKEKRAGNKSDSETVSSLIRGWIREWIAKK
jgi:hypothetical protein